MKIAGPRTFVRVEDDKGELVAYPAALFSARWSGGGDAPMRTKDEAEQFERFKLQAQRLPDADLERHSRVADMEGATRCRICFCCAAEEVLLARKEEKYREFGYVRKNHFYRIEVTDRRFGGASSRYIATAASTWTAALDAERNGVDMHVTPLD